MFKLNVLKAGSGDSILISYLDDKCIEKNILIDGGVGEIYKKEIKHIMKNLSQLDLVIVTHIDRDHIGGINKLLNSKDSSKVKEVYFNSADLIRKSNSNLISISDGINLVEYLNSLDIKINEEPILIGSEAKIGNIDIDFLSPPMESLNYLENEWSKVKEEQNRLMSSSKKIDNRELCIIAKDNFKEVKYEDDIANWTSLAFEVKYNNLKIWFLGDAKDSILINILKSKGYSQDNNYKIDYLKLSHHGSKYNTSQEFLSLINCNHFIFSTNGTHQKPHIETIARILCNEQRDLKEKIYLYFNYPKEQYVSKKVRLLTEEEEQKYNCKCIYNKNIFELKE